MAQKKQIIKHPRRSGPNKSLMLLLVVLLLICAVLFLLERMRGRYQESAPAPVEQAGTIKMPERGVTGYEQKPYTTARELPPVKVAKLHPAVLKGSMAVIVDDMGTSVREADQLAAINLPITFAIIPGLANSRKVADYAKTKGRGVMLHIPMEPQGYPEQRLEKNGLLVSQDAGEITARVREFIKEVPDAVGANNHMGSRFTEQEDKMLPVLAVLKENGLFFIDSKTSSKSVGYNLAMKMGVPAGARNVFLDNEQDVEAVKKQLREAARLANKRGSAIAICHPHPGTMQALKELMPILQREGINFVYAAQLVR